MQDIRNMWQNVQKNSNYNKYPLKLVYVGSKWSIKHSQLTTIYDIISTVASIM